MTAAPPPPPPPRPTDQAAAPPLPGPSRHDLRRQRRWARAALRQQKALAAVQQRLQQRRSLVGPVLLVGLGSTLLVLQAGHLSATSALLWLGRWWPLVLLASGLLHLLEGVLDTWPNRTSVDRYLPRRRLGPGAILLLVLIAVLGLSGRTLEQVSAWARRSGNANLLESVGLERLLARHLQNRVVLSASLAEDAPLTIRSYAGDIRITGDSQDGQVHVVAEQQLTAWDSQELRQHSNGSRPLLQPDGTGLLLTAAGQGLDRTHLTIQLPHRAGVTIVSGRGDLAINELHGAVAVTDHGGTLHLSALTGPVTLTSQDDDAAITAHSLDGDITLDGHAGDLDFSDITGSLRLQGDFFGSTHLRQIHAPIHFRSSFTDLSVASLPGDLLIEGRSELTAHHLQGPVTLATTDRSLTLEDLSGPVAVSNRNGPVHVSLNLPLSPVDIATTGADVTLDVPRDAAFSLDAQTIQGTIRTYTQLPQQTHGDSTSVAAQVHSGGPLLKLRTTRGRIAVLRRDAEDRSSEDKDEGAAADD